MGVETHGPSVVKSSLLNLLFTCCALIHSSILSSMSSSRFTLPFCFRCPRDLRLSSSSSLRHHLVRHPTLQTHTHTLTARREGNFHQQPMNSFSIHTGQCDGEAADSAEAAAASRAAMTAIHSVPVASFRNSSAVVR